MEHKARTILDPALYSERYIEHVGNRLLTRFKPYRGHGCELPVPAGGLGGISALQGRVVKSELPCFGVFASHMAPGLVLMGWPIHEAWGSAYRYISWEQPGGLAVVAPGVADWRWGSACNRW